MSFDQLTDRLDVNLKSKGHNTKVGNLKNTNNYLSQESGDLKRLNGNYEPVISKDRNSKMLESKDKESKTISFGGSNCNLNKFKNTNAKSSLSHLSSQKESSSSKSSNIWKLSNNDLSLKKSNDQIESIDYIQSNTNPKSVHNHNHNQSKQSSTKPNKVYDSVNYEKLVDALNMVK